MKTNYEDIVDVSSIGKTTKQSLHELLVRASAETVVPAVEDKEKVLLLAIDFQNDFMEEGGLPVLNSHKDIKNITTFMYNNMKKITSIAISLDTHEPQQIFHPCWWIDEHGNHPEPFTTITAQDVINGKWIAVTHQAESLEYVQKLERQGRKQLCIWTYHCIAGTTGAALEGQFANMLHFYSIARRSIIQKLVKGQNPLSEMYGIVRPEYDKQGYYNSQFVESLQLYDKIIIAGEAKSHCVLESVRQILEHYEGQQDVLSRVVILEDCMSSIPGFEEATELAFRSFQEKYGITIVKSTEWFIG